MIVWQIFYGTSAIDSYFWQWKDARKQFNFEGTDLWIFHFFNNTFVCSLYSIMSILECIITINCNFFLYIQLIFHNDLFHHLNYCCGIKSWSRHYHYFANYILLIVCSITVLISLGLFDKKFLWFMYVMCSMNICIRGCVSLPVIFSLSNEYFRFIF